MSNQFLKKQYLEKPIGIAMPSRPPSLVYCVKRWQDAIKVCKKTVEEITLYCEKPLTESSHETMQMMGIRLQQVVSDRDRWRIETEKARLREGK